MNINLDTWLISDTHFGHENIKKYCNRPDNHDELMINNWKRLISPRDTVLHLGDLAFRVPPEMYELINSLPGDKKIILGSHDRRSKRWYEDLGFEILPQRVWYNWGGKQVLFTHDPETEMAGWSINIHGHIHNNGYASLVDRSKDYRNISVEVMDYQPVRLHDILEGDKYQRITDAPLNNRTPR